MASQVRTWAPRLFAAVAVALVPWALWLATILPSREVAEHWDLAWAGFDILLAAALFATALAAFRRSPLMPLAATSAGTLLLVDPWFDVLTSRAGRDLAFALLLGLLAELPLAGLCFWIALDSERFYAAAARRFPARSVPVDRARQPT